MSEKSCVVIGAGLAGLAAAHRLTGEGWKVTVLEARPERIGGRVFTEYFREDPALYCELGGEWVGEDHTNMWRLCAELGLRLTPHRYDLSFAEQGRIMQTVRAGKWPFEPRLQKKLA